MTHSMQTFLEWLDSECPEQMRPFKEQLIDDAYTGTLNVMNQHPPTTAAYTEARERGRRNYVAQPVSRFLATLNEAKK